MLLRNLFNNPRVRIGLVVLALFLSPVVWYLASPLFVNREVNEDFPVASISRAAPAEATSMSSGPTPPPAQPTATAVAMPASGAEMTAAAQPSAPVALATGNFEASGVRLYDGEGTATIYQTADGRRFLRFENFRVTNGPGLYVYLSGTPFPTSGAELRQVSAFEVGPLKGNVGNQNYELPPDLDLSQFQSVVIYCKPFSAVFSNATLQFAPGQDG
ncbi:MAG: DM13 domain-containing protein [Chloroflexaceae bacterium]|jgi:hypothetical protein|nr:DM13 domain-containing protein [Chloroflexaceae bacterium]